MIGTHTGPAWLPSSSETFLPLASGREVWQQVRKHSRGLRHWLVAALAVTVVSSVLDLVVPVATGHIVDLVQQGGTSSDLVWPAIAIVASVVVGSFCGGLGQALTPSFFTSVLARLREDMMRHALGLNQQLIERAGTADLVSRAGDDVASVRDAANGAIPRLASTGTLLVVSAAGVAAMHPAFLIPVGLGALVYTLSIRRFLRQAPPVYQGERQRSTVQSQHILSTLHGLDAVRTFGVASQRVHKVSDASWQAVRWGLLGRFLTNTLTVQLIFGELLVLLSAVGVGVLLVAHQLSTVGAASAAILMLMRVFGPVRFLLLFLDGLQSAFVSLQRIVGVILAEDRPASGHSDGATRPSAAVVPTVPEPPTAAGGAGSADAGNESRTGVLDGTIARSNAHRSPDLFSARSQFDDLDDRELPSGAIAAEHITFSYLTGDPVLHDVSLELRPGEHLALVGESGAGKTTFAALLADLLIPDGGRVQVGADHGRTGPAVVLVSQEVHTFSGSLRDDLALGLPDGIQPPDLDALLWQVLETVGAASWAQGLADGLDTLVGRLGRDLHPARAQQIALARVLLANPEIVILDEATAEAGSSGASVLDAAARKVMEGRTALIVAHRLSQVMMADRVAVMAAGRIVELGVPEDLLASGGVFATLWRTWQAPRQTACS